MDGAGDGEDNARVAPERNQPTTPGRSDRRSLLAAGTIAIGSLLVPSEARAAGCPPPRRIVQPRQRTPRAFMDRAEAMRREAVAAGDQPFGAVVVLRSRIVGLGPSRVVTAADPTAHAELEAIRDAARRRGVGSLEGAVLYSTSPPCAMCETAASYASIARLVAGPRLEDLGPPRYAGR